MSDTIRLAPLPKSVSEARRFVVEQTYDLPRALRDALELCVSELAANCVLHADSNFSVTVIRADGVRIEVTDAGSGSVEPRDASEQNIRGRGLRIVQALADAWGVQPAEQPPGKTVWVQFDLAQAV
ncbi:MAG: ATP-binding protein [Jatrophihabitantaceae bacterium]